MAARRPRATLPASTVLDADGNGTTSITARTDFAVTHTRVSVGLAPGKTKVENQPQVLLKLNGIEFESTFSGASDQSDTQHLMLASDVVECQWTGGDPGATATLLIRGIVDPE